MSAGGRGGGGGGGGEGGREGARGRRVRRKLAFDQLIKTKSTAIKDNINSVHTTLRDKHTV